MPHDLDILIAIASLIVLLVSIEPVKNALARRRSSARGGKR